jgi:hypothetical protein
MQVIYATISRMEVITFIIICSTMSIVELGAILTVQKCMTDVPDRTN